jgi:uncharacterized protein with NRDE domain
MCLVALSMAQNPRFPWVLASNRDEFFNRPAAALDWWSPGPEQQPLLGGRDLAAGGTWLALNAKGYLALVTNVRESPPAPPGGLSRGALVPQALAAQAPANSDDDEWLTPVLSATRSGFNLLVAHLAGAQARWISNRPSPQTAQPQTMGPGVYGLSNAALDTPWPKLTRLRRMLDVAVCAAPSAAAIESAAFAALADRSRVPDDRLPKTGVPLQRERQLSSAFIRILGDGGSAKAVYGTRCSTVVVVEQLAHHRNVRVVERRFDDSGHALADSVVQFDLPPASVPTTPDKVKP